MNLEYGHHNNIVILAEDKDYGVKMDINETKEEIEKLHKDFQAWIVKDMFFKQEILDLMKQLVENNKMDKDMFFKQEMLDLMKQLVENTKMEDVAESPAESAWRKMENKKCPKCRFLVCACKQGVYDIDK